MVVQTPHRGTAFFSCAMRNVRDESPPYLGRRSGVAVVHAACQHAVRDLVRQLVVRAQRLADDEILQQAFIVRGGRGQAPPAISRKTLTKIARTARVVMSTSTPTWSS